MARLPLVLVFSESPNDSFALKHLIKAFRLPDCDIQVRRTPMVLSKGAARRKLNSMASIISALAQAESSVRHVIVVAHRDCDAVEPAHLSNAQQLRQDLRAAGVRVAVAATPAWEIESWWMLFPEALAAVRGCWSKVDFSRRNVGHINDAKEVLRSALRPSGHGSQQCRDYEESDSVRIAEEIVRLRQCDDETRLKADSLLAFRNDIRQALGVLV